MMAELVDEALRPAAAGVLSRRRRTAGVGAVWVRGGDRPPVGWRDRCGLSVGGRSGGLVKGLIDGLVGGHDSASTYFARERGLLISVTATSRQSGKPPAARSRPPRMSRARSLASVSEAGPGHRRTNSHRKGASKAIEYP